MIDCISQESGFKDVIGEKSGKVIYNGNNRSIMANRMIKIREEPRNSGNEEQEEENNILICLKYILSFFIDIIGPVKLVY